DAARDELLQQSDLPVVVGHAPEFRERIPQLLHDDQQLLRLDAFVTSLGGHATQDVVQLVRMIAASHRAIHHGAERFYRLGLELRRRCPVEGHRAHRSREGRVGGVVAENPRAESLPMFRARQASLVYRLRTADRMPPSQPRRAEPSESSPVVLILSGDAVAAALLGFLVETLGYDVRFARPPESPSATLRRVRPRICL